MIQKGTVPFCTLWVHVAFRFTEPGYEYSGASVKGREWSALEDPVKNGACLRNVRPRRGR